MRARGLALLVLCGALAAGAPAASAQPGRPAPGQARPAAAAAGAQPARADRWGDGRTATDPRERPAQGSPYNWRQMGFAAILMGLMLAFVIWLIRRETRRR